MRPPIIIAEGLDVSFYSSAAAAALSLEGPDVLEGVYEAYDAEGRRLMLRATGGARDYSAPVIVEAGGEPATDALAKLLREFLSAARHQVPPQASLDQLLGLSIAAAGLRTS